MIIKKISTSEEFAGLKTSWQALFETAGVNSPFLSWEWMFTWWEVYRNQLTAAQLAIFCAYEKDTLRALLPLFYHKKKHLAYVQFLGTEFESSDYLDIIAAENEKADFLRLFFSDPQMLALLKRADILVLNNVKEEAALFREKNRLAGHVYERRTSVCPYITLPDSLDELFKKLSKNMRSGLKRQRNKLRRNAHIQIELVEKETAVAEAIQQLFKLHGMRFEQKEMATKFVYERRGKFHETIAKIFLLKNRLQFYLIKDQDKPIGALYCYRLNGIMMYMQGGFDPDYAKLALGNQIILRAIGDAIDGKMDIFDFMRGNEPYKKKWTDKSIVLYTLDFPLSRKGIISLQFREKINSLKKTIKKIIALVKI